MCSELLETSLSKPRINKQNALACWSVPILFLHELIFPSFWRFSPLTYSLKFIVQYFAYNSVFFHFHYTFCSSVKLHVLGLWWLAAAQKKWISVEPVVSKVSVGIESHIHSCGSARASWNALSVSRGWLLRDYDVPCPRYRLLWRTVWYTYVLSLSRSSVCFLSQFFSFESQASHFPITDV